MRQFPANPVEGQMSEWILLLCVNPRILFSWEKIKNTDLTCGWLNVDLRLEVDLGSLLAGVTPNPQRVGHLTFRDQEII